MDIWYTWLGYLGLIGGLVAAAFFGWPALRSAVLGFAGGLALVTLVNVTVPSPVSCLQSSKGADILRAYSLKCPDPTKDLLPRR
jgi:hypothetical protein